MTTTPAMQQRLADDLEHLRSAVAGGDWLAAERRCREWAQGPRSALGGAGGSTSGVSDPTGSAATDRAFGGAPSPDEFSRALMALARAASSAVELLGRAQPGERVQREAGLDLQAANGAGRGVCEVCEEAGAFPTVVVLRPIPQDRETMAEDPAPWRVCEACRSSWRRSDLSRSDWRAERVERLRLAGRHRGSARPPRDVGGITHESGLTHATQPDIVPI